MSEWYLHREGAPPSGPLSTQRLLEELRSGAVPLTARACRGANDPGGWVPVTQIPELAPMLALLGGPAAGGPEQEATTSRWQSARPPPPPEPSRRPMLAAGAIGALCAGAALAVLLLRPELLGLRRHLGAGADEANAPASAGTAAPAPAASPPAAGAAATAAESAAMRAPAAGDARVTSAADAGAASAGEGAAGEGAAGDGTMGEGCGSSLPTALCAWLEGRARGEALAAPPSAVLQAFFLERSITPLRVRIVGEAGRVGRYQVTANGVWGHCLELAGARAAQPGETFSLWVRKKPDKETYTSPAGREEACVALEESALAQAIMDLSHSPDGPRGPALDAAGEQALAARALDIARGAQGEPAL